MTRREKEQIEVTFCFVDIAGFTALTEAHGGSAAADLIERFRELVDAAREGRGQVVDRAGDALFLVWWDLADSVQFVSRLMASARGETDFPELRVGLHHGQAIERDGGYFGPDVNLAARVAAGARARQVLATARVAEAASDVGLSVTALGPRQFKNVQGEIEVFSLDVGLPEVATSIDPVCKMRVSHGAAGGRLRFHGETYWFCSIDCARRFAESPTDFAPTTDAPVSRKEPRPFYWAVGVLLVVLLALGGLLRLANIQHAEFEVDELQHLHAAYMVSRGEVPYQDFFEHHTPLFYLVGGLFIDPESADTDTIFRFRTASLLAHVVTLALGTVIAALGGAPAAFSVLVFLLLEIFSFAWGTLTFLDSFAAPLLLLSALILSARPRALASHLAAGLLIGAAILLTQKAIFAAPAPLALVLLRAPKKEARRFVLGRAVALALGGAVLPLVFLLWRLGPEGFAAFWDSAVALNSRWVARRWPSGEAFIAIAYGGVLWILAGAGLVGAGARLQARLEVPSWALVPVLYLAALLVGTLVLPVVWYEYFVLIGPFVAVVAGIAALDLARIAGLLGGEPTLLRPRSWLPPLMLGMLTAVTILQVVLRLTDDHYSPTWSIIETLAIAALGVLLIAALKRSWNSKRYTRVACLGLALACLLPLVNQLSWLRRPGNSPQRRAIEFVHENVAPHEAVFDGYSGYGVFRPHAYKYWFLHDEMQQMLSEHERSTGIIDRLAHPTVRAAVRDEYSRELPNVVQTYLDEHFSQSHRRVWLRSTPKKGHLHDE